MTPFNDALWSRWRYEVSDAFERLAGRVQARVTDAVSRNGSSTNKVKPIHIVRSFFLPGSEDNALVVSTMFTFFGGSLKVHGDLTKEDGPILLDLGTRDLGSKPTESEIDAVVNAVVAFVAAIEQPIVDGLEGQRIR